MKILDSARYLYKALDSQAVVIGGLCGAAHGVVRYTADVDFATDMSPNGVMDALRDAGIEATIKRGDIDDPLPWVISGEYGGIPFQVLPAKNIGVNIAMAMIDANIGFASQHDYITSKCIAGSPVDLYDVAVLLLQQPELKSYAESQAEKYGCKETLDRASSDRRLKNVRGDTNKGSQTKKPK